MDDVILIMYKVHHFNHLFICALWQQDVHELAPTDLASLLWQLALFLLPIDKGCLDVCLYFRIIISIFEKLLHPKLGRFKKVLFPLFSTPHRP